MAKLPERLNPDAPIFAVSVAAELAGMHAQTLRQYDRIGLVVPNRTKSGRRRYSPRDVNKLRLIQHLSQEEGVNLNGIRRIIEMSNQIDSLKKRNEELSELLEQVLARGDEHRVFTATVGGSIYRGRIRRDLLAIDR